MSTIKDGGQAFPINDTVYANGQVQYGSNGMTLRDYFAACADIPWNTVLDTLKKKHPERGEAFTVGEAVESRSRIKYMEADAMLKAREEIL